MNNKAGVMTCLFTTGFTQHFKSTVEIYCSEDSFQITTAIDKYSLSTNTMFSTFYTEDMVVNRLDKICFLFSQSLC